MTQNQFYRIPEPHSTVNGCAAVLSFKRCSRTYNHGTHTANNTGSVCSRFDYTGFIGLVSWSIIYQLCTAHSRLIPSGAPGPLHRFDNTQPLSWSTGPITQPVYIGSLPTTGLYPVSHQAGHQVEIRPSRKIARYGKGFTVQSVLFWSEILIKFS